MRDISATAIRAKIRRGWRRREGSEEEAEEELENKNKICRIYARFIKAPAWVLAVINRIYLRSANRLIAFV